MARRLRIQYSDAIYHVMARGNGRRDIVQDDADRGRLVACLERAVRRSGWSLYAFVFLTNHLHLVLKTPRPNLAKGMQLFLSSYANGWARRHRHCGHLFQGRYRTELVEDETYLWVLTRYVHLNPVRAGLSATPEAWISSSCPGYFRRRDRLDWVAYDALLAAWAGEFGRTDPGELKGDSHQIWRTQRVQVNVTSLRFFLRSSTGPNRAFEPQSLGSVRDPVRIAEGPTAMDAATQRRHFGFRLRLVDKLQPSGGGSGQGHPLSGTWATWMAPDVMPTK